MALVIGAGIEIGSGITISQGPSAIRALLSPTGQAAYDAAVTDGWFSVSATDYGTGGMSWLSMGPWGGNDANGGAYSNTMSSWTTFNFAIPAQQWLLTNVEQW
jgi:hypothetical protein